MGFLPLSINKLLAPFYSKKARKNSRYWQQKLSALFFYKKLIYPRVVFVSAFVARSVKISIITLKLV